MAFEVNWLAAESKRCKDGVHISHAIPLQGAYKLSHEGLAATLWPSAVGVTQTASGQQCRNEVFFLAIYTAKKSTSGVLFGY